MSDIYFDKEFVYSGFIWKYFLDTLQFDFYPNGENIFTERKLFYNDVLKEIAAITNLKDSFIAGEFFIKYQKSNFDSEKNYNEFCSNQPIDVYIYCNKITHEITIDEILETINKKYHQMLERDKNVYFKYVYATFKLDQITLRDDVQLKNIRIHICYKKFQIVVKNFKYQTSKIGFIYNDDHLITGNWFMKGGVLGDEEKNCVKFKSIDCKRVTPESYCIYF
jgi:hypothetical protein